MYISINVHSCYQSECCPRLFALSGNYENSLMITWVDFVFQKMEDSFSNKMVSYNHKKFNLFGFLTCLFYVKIRRNLVGWNHNLVAASTGMCEKKPNGLHLNTLFVHQNRGLSKGGFIWISSMFSRKGKLLLFELVFWAKKTWIVLRISLPISFIYLKAAEWLRIFIKNIYSFSFQSKAPR